MSEPLYMIQARLERLALLRYGRSLGLPLAQSDQGYLTHALLRGLFGPLAPQPFALPRPTSMTVWGYAAVDHHVLLEQARAAAQPLALAALDAASLCSKTMPARWPRGWSAGFEVRVCPVVRTARPDGAREREVDAFLARCWRDGPSVEVDREAVYRDWIISALEAGGAAHVTALKLVSFQRSRLWRRQHGGAGRNFHRCERPDVSATGRLEVAEPEAFAALLRRGLGRHRAFGFGMLLLHH
jgi:CRISPR system Cascade subunit CasE